MFDDLPPGELVCAEARMINLCGEIDDLLAQKVVRGLYQLAAVGTEPITLLISSGGGGVYEANAIADAIEHVQSMGVEVKARVHGFAMSAAVFPLLVSRKREAASGAAFMIHGMHAGNSGDLRDLKAEQTHNEWLMEIHASVLGRFSNHPVEFWLPLLNESFPHYYTAVQALEMGLIDAIT